MYCSALNVLSAKQTQHQTPGGFNPVVKLFEIFINQSIKLKATDEQYYNLYNQESVFSVSDRLLINRGSSIVKGDLYWPTTYGYINGGKNV